MASVAQYKFTVKSQKEGASADVKRNEDEMNKRLTGTITYANPVRTYGFIQEDSSGIHYFYHFTNVAPGFTPMVATRVEFELAPPIKIGKPDQAVNVRHVGGGK